jgi:hypothetical protein
MSKLVHTELYDLVARLRGRSASARRVVIPKTTAADAYKHAADLLEDTLHRIAAEEKPAVHQLAVLLHLVECSQLEKLLDGMGLLDVPHDSKQHPAVKAAKVAMKTPMAHLAAEEKARLAKEARTLLDALNLVEVR